MFHNPQIDPIYKSGTNGAGVLLLHGFTGTPDCMRFVANKLNENGFSVLAPLLSGHGTTSENLAQTNWQDWYHTASKAYMELAQKCSRLFVCGLSLGALLSLKLAIEYPQAFSGVSCLATPLYLKTWVRALLPVVWHSPLKKIWRYQKKADVDIKDPIAKANFWNNESMPISCIASLMEFQKLIRLHLKKIEVPLLLIHSRHDNTAPYESMNQTAKMVSSSVTETVTLENSQHIITMDYDKEIVALKVASFFQRFL